MSELLGFVPVLASATLGLIYLWMGDGSSVTKAVGLLVFLAAAYLQFWAPYMVPGILLQAMLALVLEFWRRSHLA